MVGHWYGASNIVKLSYWKYWNKFRFIYNLLINKYNVHLVIIRISSDFSCHKNSYTFLSLSPPMIYKWWTLWNCYLPWMTRLHSTIVYVNRHHEKWGYVDHTCKYCCLIDVGAHLYRSITRTYYRNSVGVLMVYDITSRQSFEDMLVWLNEALRVRFRLAFLIASSYHFLWWHKGNQLIQNSMFG